MWYVSKDSKKEDLKSTASTFLPFSVIGYVALALLLFDFLPVRLAGANKILTGGVLFVMLTIFFAVGLTSLLQLKKVSAEADAENKKSEELILWFKEQYPPEKIDETCDLTLGKEQLYFERYDRMKELIQEKYPDIPEEFSDHVIELIYQQMFPEQ